MTGFIGTDRLRRRRRNPEGPPQQVRDGRLAERAKTPSRSAIDAAPGSPRTARIAAAHLLEAERVFRLAGSDDPALQLVLDHVGPAVVPVGTRGSFPGLRALARGTADGAAIHLRHVSGVYNAPFATALPRHRGPLLLRLWRREQGLIVAPGNPHGVGAAADLVTLRVAKRETGADTRVLLDQLLADAGIAPHDVHGPELHSHLEIALAVAAGIADAGLGLRSAANDLDLDFLPVTWEQYDIALAVEALGAAQPLLTALDDPSLRSAITGLGGYDLSGCGTIEALSDDYMPNRARRTASTAAAGPSTSTCAASCRPNR